MTAAAAVRGFFEFLAFALQLYLLGVIVNIALGRPRWIPSERSLLPDLALKKGQAP